MNIYWKAVEFFGVLKQKFKAMEEASEFIRAIARDDRENVVEEYVDLMIMMKQVEYIYEITPEEISLKLQEKLLRLEKMIKKGNRG